MTTIRVMLVDDHPMILEVLGQLVNAQEDMEVVEQVNSAEAVLRQAEHHRPDVLLLDVSLPGANGLDLISAIKKQVPDVRIVMLSMHHNSAYVSKAFHLGAHGYVLKGVNSRYLLSAIRKVSDGDYFLCQEVRGDVPPDFLDTIKSNLSLNKI